MVDSAVVGQIEEYIVSFHGFRSALFIAEYQIDPVMQILMKDTERLYVQNINIIIAENDNSKKD